METQNVWKKGLNANNVIKAQMQSLDFVCQTMNALAYSANEVSDWFNSIGLDRMPKSGKPSDKGVFLTTELVQKYWDCKDSDGNLCRKQTKDGKQTLVPVTKFTPFAVIKACYALHKQAVASERKAVVKSAKKAAKAQKEATKAKQAQKEVAKKTTVKAAA
jgi:hypothetical protein